MTPFSTFPVVSFISKTLEQLALQRLSRKLEKACKFQITPNGIMGSDAAVYLHLPEAHMCYNNKEGERSEHLLLSTMNQHFYVRNFIESAELGNWPSIQNQNDIWNCLTFQTKVEYSQKFIS